jgi:hypothetical protein
MNPGDRFRSRLMGYWPIVLRIGVQEVQFRIKHKIRIAKSETNSNDQTSKFKTFLFWSLRFWSFVLISDFVLRISDLKITPVQKLETKAKIMYGKNQNVGGILCP